MAGLTIGGAIEGFAYGGLTGSGGYMTTGTVGSAAGFAIGGALIGAGVFTLAFAGWNPAFGGALIGAGAGFIYGGATGRSGGFDWERAAAFGLSGAMVGAGIGLSASVFGQTIGGQALSGGLIGAGLAGLRSQQGADPEKGFDWSIWGKRTFIGGVSGAVGGALGGLAGGSIVGQFAGGVVTSYVSQSLEMAFGLREEYSALEMLAGGAGNAIGAKLGQVAIKPFQNAAGGVSCVATKGAVRWLAYHGAQGGAGAAGGAASNALGQLASGQPWDWQSFWEDTALGAVQGVAGARAGYKNRVCFIAGTPILTSDGSACIETLQIGDQILSRDEHDANADVGVQVVEEVFVRYGKVLWLIVNGQKIGTTAEHPFWVVNRDAWVAASELAIGDVCLGHDGKTSVLEGTEEGEWATVYNLRVSEWHTYFVGSKEWGFHVWVHNVRYAQNLEDMPASMQRRGMTEVEGSQYHAAPERESHFLRTSVTNADGTPVQIGTKPNIQEAAGRKNSHVHPSADGNSILVESGGTTVGKGNKPTKGQQEAAHTEPQTLKLIEEHVSIGAHIEMEGMYAPCGACQDTMAKFIDKTGTKVTYSWSDTSGTYQWRGGHGEGVDGMYRQTGEGGWEPHAMQRRTGVGSETHGPEGRYDFMPRPLATRDQLEIMSHMDSYKGTKPEDFLPKPGRPW